MTQPLLAIDNLSVGFRQQGTVRTVVNEISLHVEAGQTTALVGESGSGKASPHSPFTFAPHTSGGLSCR